MNEYVVYKSVDQLLAPEWLDITDAPKSLFKCIVIFEETFSNNMPVFGIGWMHPTGFKSDAEVFNRFTPIKFIPLYQEHENQSEQL